MNFVSYDVAREGNELPLVRAKVHGMDGTFTYLARGAVPWHASAQLRKVAVELNALADQFDRDYPRDAHLT